MRATRCLRPSPYGLTCMHVLGSLCYGPRELQKLPFGRLTPMILPDAVDGAAFSHQDEATRKLGILRHRILESRAALCRPVVLTCYDGPSMATPVFGLDRFPPGKLL